MRAVLFTGPGQIELAQVPDPVPAPGEVVVAPAAVGLCGTDLHILDGDLARGWPTVPGHEFAGRVVEIGSEVADAGGSVSVGDQVAVDPSLYCGQCYYCRRARGNQCERWGSLGVTAPGAAAELVAVPATSCVRLPGHVDPRDAALIEPLACAVRGMDVLDAQVGQHVLVYGAGPMGLMMLQLAKCSGAASVTVVDTDAGRREGARELGCAAAVESAEQADRERGFDVVVDCTGVVAAIEDGLGRVGRGGTFLQFGVAPRQATARINPYRIYHEEIRVIGSMAVLHSFERAADLFAAGAVDPAQLITHRYPLEDYAEAMATFRAGTGRKVQVLPGR